jgi:hypothetical protein
MQTSYRIGVAEEVGAVATRSKVHGTSRGQGRESLAALQV